jgi:stage IV sporulation protein FB
MLGTSETAYDLRFRFLGIPVRVHPLFWLVTALMRHSAPLWAILMWTACVLVSILVHEYGHGLTARSFGSAPSIVLWGLGGLCYSESDRQTRLQRLAVVLMGPGAGFIFCAVVMAAASILFGVTLGEHLGVCMRMLGLGQLNEGFGFRFPSDTAFDVYWNLVWINLMWGLVNLLPIWPLDGGRVAEILLSYVDRFRSTRWTHIVSLLTAGCLALLAGMHGGITMSAVFFGILALYNFQVLQSMHQAHAMGMYHEDDWWRR